MPNIPHEVITAYGQFSLAIATVIIALLVYRATKNIAKMEYHRHLIEQWQDINLLLIQDKDAWYEFQKLRSDPENIDDKTYKRNQIIALQLNMAEGYYRGMKLGYIEKKIADSQISVVIRNLGKEREFVVDSMNIFYSNDFVEYMKDRFGKLK